MCRKYVEIIKTSRDLLKSFGYFMDNLWHVDDIHLICEQKKFPQLTDKEAMEVFNIANKHFDGENGLGWPQIEQALEYYLKRNKGLVKESIFEK